ncbi:TonB-dependent receptor [Pedobacter sp. SD-b]|uniref:TonB-dependent receptor n=2 Tax=Pedobacter segetis TaxID=2793069 RepID=A0ABS1BJS7_9SPHI|nr:TonB-dependent receptor [Pedobacter segetis]
MRKKILLFLLVIGFTLSAAFAQTRLITGKVTDSTTGETLIGVSVTVVGTKTGTQTDVNGNYSIKAASGSTLTFTYIGFKVKSVKISEQKTLNVILENDSQLLNEVVAIGYQTVNRRDLTGSVSSIGAKQLKDTPINSTAEALAGRLAGVQIISSEGTPGASAQIKVRGGGSITQDNSPLYIVDGVQVEDALSSLAPQDIASIDVLKDASATAIYGSRGANGVVIITTKGGKEQAPKISYSGLVGARKLLRTLDVLKPYDFVLYQYDRSRGSTTQENTFQSTYGNFADLELYKDAPFVDWQDELFGRTALQQTQNVSLTGGTATTKYNVSYTNNSEQGVQLGSDFNRNLINLKLDQKVNDKLSASFSVRYNNTNVNGAGTSSEGSSSTNRLRHAIKYKPILGAGQDLLDYDPDYALETNSNSLALINPLLLNQAEYRKNITNTTNLSGNVTYKFNKYLAFKTTVGVDMQDRRNTFFNDTITSVAKQNSNMPTAGITTSGRNSLTNSNVLTFDFSKSKSKFAKNNRIDALLGEELYQNKYREDDYSSKFFPVGISPITALGNFSLGTPNIPTSNQYTERLFSLFGRVNYTFKDKYLLTATMRADGSSKFSDGNKWGYFPSASLAWRISEEDFFKDLKEKIKVSELKLRLSYGESGNNRIDNFLYLTQFSPSGYYTTNNQLNTTYNPSALAFNDLKWETTISRNAGLDIGLFNDRIQITADAYYNTTKDLLFPVPVDPTSGYSTQLRNAASTSNKGLELQISGNIINKKNFSWNANFNLSHNKNNVESIGSISNSALYSSGWGGSNQPSDYIVRVGEPVGTIWGLVSDGFYKIDDFDYNSANGKYTLKSTVASNKSITAADPYPGGIKFKDINNDNVVDINDRTVIGNTQPKFFGGLNQQFTYKNFDLSVFVNFQTGNDVYNANKLEFTSGYTVNSNLLAIETNRWRNVNAQGQTVTDPVQLADLNKNATLWTPLTTASSFYVNSWAIEDGSFLRLNNITIGYTLPDKTLKKLRMERLRFYATVNNLAVLTNYSGYDPEVNTRRSTPITSGVDYSAYPRSSAFIFGLNLTL